MNLYPWFIVTFCGLEANGVWAACISVTMIGNLICGAVQNLLGPKISHVLASGGVLAMRGLVRKSALIFALIMSVICLFFIIAGNTLVVLLYGQKYDGNGLIVSILALNLVVASVSFPFSRGLFALERADIDFMVNIGVFLTLLTGIWLVQSFGLLGAAFGLCTANFLAVILQGIAFHKIVSR
jgi:O-antigen/teichoic acid export membrane protein